MNSVLTTAEVATEMTREEAMSILTFQNYTDITLQVITIILLIIGITYVLRK